MASGGCSPGDPLTTGPELTWALSGGGGALVKAGAPPPPLQLQAQEGVVCPSHGLPFPPVARFRNAQKNLEFASGHGLL